MTGPIPQPASNRGTFSECPPTDPPIQLISLPTVSLTMWPAPAGFRSHQQDIKAEKNDSLPNPSQYLEDGMYSRDAESY